MKRLALLALLLASCAKREEQVSPTPAEPGPATTVAPLENGPASKFKGMPVQKPAQHMPEKSPTPAASSGAPSAK